MCESVLLTSMPVDHMHAWCPQRSEEGVRSPGAGVTIAEICGVDVGNWAHVFHRNKCS